MKTTLRIPSEHVARIDYDPTGVLVLRLSEADSTNGRVLKSYLHETLKEIDAHIEKTENTSDLWAGQVV